MRSSTVHRLALAFALAPLVTGLAIYLLWRVTRWEGLEVLGMMTIVAGVPMVVFACALAVVDGVQAARGPSPSAPRLAARFLAVVLPAAACFPACTVVVESVQQVEGEDWRLAEPFTVWLRNDSGHTLEDARLEGVLVRGFGDVGHARLAQQDFRSDVDELDGSGGSLRLVGTLDGERRAWTVLAELTPRRGDRLEISLDERARVEAQVVHFDARILD